jgi:hypothetical protein
MKRIGNVAILDQGQQLAVSSALLIRGLDAFSRRSTIGPVAIATNNLRGLLSKRKKISPGRLYLFTKAIRERFSARHYHMVATFIVDYLIFLVTRNIVTKEYMAAYSQFAAHFESSSIEMELPK